MAVFDIVFIWQYKSPDTNLYTYVDNDPVNRVDPNGDSWLEHPSFFTIGMALLNFVPIGKIVKIAKVVGMGIKAVKAAKAAKRIEKVAVGACKMFCFAVGTKVQTDMGLKNIEEIKIGDKVLSKDEDTGDIGYKVVEETFGRIAPGTYKIYVGDDVFEATAEHPFWVDGQGWTEVKDLAVGNQFVTKDGKFVTIRDIIENKQETKVYNLRISDYHTYFVGLQSVWTHNCGPDTNYRKVFQKANLKTDAEMSDLVVHHGVEKQVIKKYPGLFTWNEIHAGENLRGIPKSINSDLHLSKLRNDWNAFYLKNSTTTKVKVRKFAKSLDKKYGHLFNPRMK